MREPILLDDSAAAEYLATTTRHLRGLRQRREIPYVRVGRAVRYRHEDLDRWLDQRAVPASGVAAFVERTTKRSGVPLRVEDPSTAREIADILRGDTYGDDAA